MPIMVSVALDVAVAPTLSCDFTSLYLRPEMPILVVARSDQI